MRRTFCLGEEARTNLVNALTNIAEAVGSTMGPGGSPFGYDKNGNDLKLTSTFSKDGLTVLRALGFNEPENQAVLQYCRQAASHSVLASGDGTSSTVILAAAVAKAVRDEKSNYPQYLARLIEKDSRNAIEEIRKESITGGDIVRTVALTSTNGDEELTDVVLQAVSMSSAFGSLLTVKNPASPERYKIDKQEGYSNCAGYNYNTTFAVSSDENAASSRYMDWESPYVALFNGSLLLEDQLNPILNAWTEACKIRAGKLVIVSYDVGDAVINKLLPINRQLATQGLAVFVVKPKITAEVNAGLQIMRDLASFCGVSDDLIIDGGNYRKVTSEFLGTCQSVKIGVFGSMFLGRAKNNWVVKRILQNESIAEGARSDFDREITKIRNAELAEGLVKIEIGGGLLPDLQEREDRFDDASKAAQSCLRAGALPGAGCSYIRAGILANVHPALLKALRAVHSTVMFNFGADVNPNFVPLRGEAVKIAHDGLTIDTGNAKDLKILDATETVCAVIRNGVDLGVKIATLGGYIYRGKEDDVRDY